MSAQELVSVIIPAFNAAAYLDQAITSVFEQDWESLEMIVVDDGSTDDTAAIAQSYGPRLTVLQGSHKGMAATRNRGMAAAHGSFFLHLDADDVLVPNAIRTLMGIFACDKSCAIAAGRFASFVSPELPSDVASRFNLPTDPQRGHISGVALIRAEVFAQIGTLDENYEPAADIEWWARANDSDVSIKLVDDIVVRRRIHGANISLRINESRQRISLRIIRDSLKRRQSGRT